MLNNRKIISKNIKIQQKTYIFDEEFTPPGLRLLGPASNAWASLLCSKLQKKVCLQSSNASETYVNEFKMLKNDYLASFCIQFG